MVVNDSVRMADMTEAERVDAMIEDIDKLISEWLSPLGKMTGKMEVTPMIKNPKK